MHSKRWASFIQLTVNSISFSSLAPQAHFFFFSSFYKKKAFKTTNILVASYIVSKCSSAGWQQDGWLGGGLLRSMPEKGFACCLKSINNRRYTNSQTDRRPGQVKLGSLHDMVCTYSWTSPIINKEEWTTPIGLGLLKRPCCFGRKTK